MMNLKTGGGYERVRMQKRVAKVGRARPLYDRKFIVYTLESQQIGRT
jgi:hypothetical protein